MRQGWIVAVLAGGALLAACAAGAHWLFEVPPNQSGRVVTKTVVIPEGASFRQVAELLERERLLTSQWGLLLWGKLTGADRRIHAGEYALDDGMSAKDIVTELLSGRTVLHSVTIPEGYAAAQIAELLAQKGLTDKTEFLGLVRDRSFIRSLRLDVDSLEGYLFPDTYRFSKPGKADEQLRTMVAALWQVFTPEWQARAAEIGMTVHQVLTLASVIEKETGTEEERGLVAAVFHNRLRRQIPLQSDPTVIYGLPSFGGNLTKKDLEFTSPYNTYRVRGLPPGPIASPGANSIRATLYPAPAHYLYFVSKNDGTHQFSATIAEHNRAVDKYQRRSVRRLS
jgi:UPF0755 protein